MGANRRNDLGVQSRRFSLNNVLVKDDKYVQLVNNYLDSKTRCQVDKLGHDTHEYNILKLSEYLSVAQKDFEHR